MASPRFVPGQLYRRRALHAEFGGSYQSGISFSIKAPVVFLFTGESGAKHGYRDGWQSDGTYHYSGEGQSGDMTFTRGNLAIRAHLDDGRDLYLFERVAAPTGHVRFIGQMLYAGHRLVPGVPDRDGNARTTIVFVLAPIPVGTDGDAAYENDHYDDQIPPDDEPSNRVAAVRQRVAEDAPEYRVTVGSPAEQRIWTSRATRTHVLRRAGGRCEGCTADAPFRRADGLPYLEPHDLRMGSDQDLGGPEHVVALCPTCHRRVHHGEDGLAYNQLLLIRLYRME